MTFRGHPVLLQHNDIRGERNKLGQQIKHKAKLARLQT